MRNDNKVALILSVALAAIIGLTLVLISGVANAGEGECVPVAAQHYSYTGGPIEGVPAPPPAEGWQANTTQEPPGHYQTAYKPDGSAYVEGDSGLHYTSHGSSGLADWFYFQPEVVCTSPTPPPPTSPPPTSPPPSDGGDWTPSWTPTPPGVVGHSGGGTAFTGADVTVPAIIGGALALFGLGALLVARKLSR